MPDPISIGSLTAVALAWGAEAVVKTGVGEVVKDAYKRLKDAVSQWAGGEVATLEAAPTSTGTQLAVAKIIDVMPEDQKAQVRSLAIALNEALRIAANAGEFVIDVGRLDANNINLRNINLPQGGLLRGDAVRADGTVDGLRALARQPDRAPSRGNAKTPALLSFGEYGLEDPAASPHHLLVIRCSRE